MDEKFHSLIEQVEDVKLKLTDNEYKRLVETVAELREQNARPQSIWEPNFFPPSAPQNSALTVMMSTLLDAFVPQRDFELSSIEQHIQTEVRHQRRARRQARLQFEAKLDEDEAARERRRAEWEATVAEQATLTAGAPLAQTCGARTMKGARCRNRRSSPSATFCRLHGIDRKQALE
jgi:hypothetical protein